LFQNENVVLGHQPDLVSAAKTVAAVPLLTGW